MSGKNIIYIQKESNKSGRGLGSHYSEHRPGKYHAGIFHKLRLESSKKYLEQLREKNYRYGEIFQKAPADIFVKEFLPILVVNTTICRH